MQVILMFRSTKVLFKLLLGGFSLLLIIGACRAMARRFMGDGGSGGQREWWGR